MAIGNERDPKSSPESPDTHPPGEANSAAAVGEVSGEEDVLRMSI